VGVSDLFIIIPAGLLSSFLLAATMLPGFSGRIMLPVQQVSNSPFDKLVALILVLTILATLMINLFFYMPPLLIFMFGLSLVFLLANVMDHADEIPIMEYVRKIEFDTLLFFLGILLIVGMLREIGVLSAIPELYQFSSPMLANYFMGMLSALIDNVPLTAAILKAGLDMNLNEWLGLTFAVGAGGSLLAIGSAAGVLAMSKVEGLSFIAYLKYFPNIFFAFSVGYLLVVFL
jgi:Na+/H+ antiporter NhaD/arsenite permease-like protein